MVEMARALVDVCEGDWGWPCVCVLFGCEDAAERADVEPGCCLKAARKEERKKGR